MEQTLMDTEQTATYLHVKPETLKVWRKRRKGPPFLNVETAVRYRREEVDEWLEAHRRPTPVN